MSPLAAWILALMLSLQPAAPWLDTFASTAEAVERAAVRDPVFGSPERTAAVLVSLAWYESRFKQDAVDPGRTSFCLIQVDGSNLRGLGATRAQVLSDPDACLAAGLALVHTSLRICRGRPLLERLANYASGGPTCSVEDGLRKSRYRVGMGLELLRRMPPPKQDADVD